MFAKIKRNFRGVKYDIEFIPGNEFGVFVDGNKIEGNVIPLFEDRAVYKSVKAQIESAGCKECYSEEDADILLFCNIMLYIIFRYTRNI